MSEGRERRSSETFCHPIAPVTVSRHVSELKGAVAGLLAQVVCADVEVLAGELVGSVGSDGERRLVVDVEHRPVAAASDGREQPAEVGGFFGGDGGGLGRTYSPWPWNMLPLGSSCT